MQIRMLDHQTRRRAGRGPGTAQPSAGEEADPRVAASPEAEQRHHRYITDANRGQESPVREFGEGIRLGRGNWLRGDRTSREGIRLVALG